MNIEPYIPITVPIINHSFSDCYKILSLKAVTKWTLCNKMDMTDGLVISPFITKAQATLKKDLLMLYLISLRRPYSNNIS